MKYRLATLLVLALLFALSVTAHAAQIPTEPDGIGAKSISKKLR